MQDIKQIKSEIRKLEQKIYDLKKEVSEIKLRDINESAYQIIQDEITALEKEINSDVIYIKNTYNQILAIKRVSDYAIRHSNDVNALKVSEKAHRAFLMLIQYNRILDNKIAEFRNLIAERAKLIEGACDKAKIKECEEQIIEAYEQKDRLHQKLRDSESVSSASAVVKNRVIDELQERQRKIEEWEREIRELEEHKDVYCSKCKIKLQLKSTQDGNIFYSCPNWKKGDPSGLHSIAWIKEEDKETARKNHKRCEELKQKIKKIEDNPPEIPFAKKEKEALQHSSIAFNEYPNISESNYSNYLFQSLAVPKGLEIQENFMELLRYSRFRIFTKLSKSNLPDPETRTIFSLALRLMNRGVVLATNEKSQAKIKRYFCRDNSNAFLLSLNEYISYKAPCNTYDSSHEKDFAEYYFPKLLGESWATYVYPQMPIEKLLPEEEQKNFVDQRVDFFVCFGGKKVVIELDGEEHQSKTKSDAIRDEKLLRNGYTVKRFSNIDVKIKTEEVLNELKNIFPIRPSAVVEFGEKYLVACKTTHQIAIAIIKMLEEGHISPHCNLDIEISSKYFTLEEQKLLLLFATEEAKELIESFSRLYGVSIDIDFFDKNSEKYWIQIGDGDSNINSIVIRDIVLPINYLCSINPFSLILPQKDAITEELLEYFLQYIFGYSQFRPGQFAAIRRTLRKEESIVLLPTGSGKSVIYQLSSMLLPGITVVISPLRALIEDQVNNLANRCIHNVAAIYRADENSKEEMVKKAKAIMNNHSAMMLYIAPERMQIPDFRNEIKAHLVSNNFCLIAIDEAHCVSEWGHDFRAAYLQIARSCRTVFKKDDFVPPIIALTGTASDNVLRDVKRDLEITNSDAIITPPDFDRSELHYSILPCNKEQKFDRILDLLRKDICNKLDTSFEEFSKLRGENTISGIIFTPLARKKDSIYSAWNVFNQLNSSDTQLQVGTYFSTPPQLMPEDNKDEIWQNIIKSYAKDFKSNQRQLLVATKAFGMGIDKPNIRYIIHCGLSTSIEQYYQEVGRAGRDGAHSECFMLFTDVLDSKDVNLIDPNKNWEDFNKEYKKMSEDEKQDFGDMSPLLYFHTNNFKGADSEKTIIFAVLDCLATSSDNFNQFTEEYKARLSAKEISSKCIEKSKSTVKDFTVKSIDISDNDIAKAIIRLVTLGVIKDYEYDYSKYEYKVVYGSIERSSVLEKYLTFVDGCSRGRANDEKQHLEQVRNDNIEFVKAVVSRYVDLVYGTIEKGRRRALYSMFRLAQGAMVYKGDPDRQDAYIRSEILSYLKKDDTVERVASSNLHAGIYDILHDYQLYPNDVIVDSIEQEKAKKASLYTARMLEANPHHPGLLYLHAITLIKSRDYHNSEVVNDIIAAYSNSGKYSIPFDSSIEFLVKVLNLAFNSSCELFKLLWDKIDKKIVNSIVEKTMESNNNVIGEHFKDYLLLHMASEALRKMIGD